MLSILVVAAIAVVVSTALTPVVRKFARWAGAVDAPGGRRVHAVATARMGGAAVFGAYVVGLGATMGLGLFPWASGAASKQAVLAFLAGGLFIMLVGMVDDVRGIG